jgi:integrase
VSIYPEKRNGVPTGVIVVEVEKDGKRIRRKTRDPKEAKRLEAMLQVGLVPDPKDPEKAIYTLERLKADCRGLWAGLRDEKRTLKQFALCVEVLKGVLGDTPFPTIRTTHLDEFANRLEARGLQAATVNRYLSVLSKVLGWAYEREHIERLPKVPWRFVEPPEVFWLSEEDEEKLQAAIRSIEVRHDRLPAEDLILLSKVQVASGTRISELLGLTPDQVIAGEELTPDQVIAGEEQFYELDLGITKNRKERHSSIPASLGEPFKALVERGLPSYDLVYKRLRRARIEAGLAHHATDPRP